MILRRWRRVRSSRFSAREIRQLKPRDKPYKVTESAPRGEGRLIVRIHPGGLKEFYYRYRLNERDRLLRIGRFEQTPGDGGMKLEEARAQLTKLVGIQRATGDVKRELSRRHEQTFGGEPLYPTVQARAAHLLYFVIKDHPFADGNKRIGTLLFLEYLRRNNLLLRADGQPRLVDNAMVALALLVAESDPKHKDLMIRLTLNLL